MTTMTKELLTKMTPKEAVDKLMEGNTRFQNNALVPRILQSNEKKSAPPISLATILSCIDRAHLQKLFLIKGLGLI